MTCWGADSGTMSQHTGSNTAFDDDAAGRLLDINQNLYGTSSGHATLGYDAAGGIARRGESNESYAFPGSTASIALAPDGLNRYASVRGILG